ncbi:MAG TPA: thioesterase family protein [Steroidobacteraceae bacterium]|nr:thioesterase family protein [Steroidobacteraceae bacterium]
MSFVYEMRDGRAFTTSFAAGPWSPNHQHGAAPTCLICWAVERIPTLEPMQVARITVELLRPVPIAPLEIKTEILREGRKIQLCFAQLFADGVEVVRANVLKIRTTSLTLPDTAKEEPISLPMPDASRVPKPFPDDTDKFVSGLELRFARGGFRPPGPAAVWFRAKQPIISGEPISQLMRAAIASDFCNGVSSRLNFNQWTFINADLNINLARMPVGEWVLLDAESYVGPTGAGVAFARLGDMQGYFGRAVQSLVIEPRKK